VPTCCSRCILSCPSDNVEGHRYADGHFTEVFDESTRWQLAVPVSKKLSPTNGSSSRRIQGDVAECSARLEQKRPREFERPPVQEGESGVGASDLCGLENASRRTRERKLSVRMREAVLDLTDDSEDDFRCDLYKMRNGQQYSGRNKKKPRKGDGMSLSPTKERSTALKFAGAYLLLFLKTRCHARNAPLASLSLPLLLPQMFGFLVSCCAFVIVANFHLSVSAGSLLPKDFLQDTKDPLFVGCNVEVRIEPKGEWIRARSHLVCEYYDVNAFGCRDCMMLIVLMCLILSFLLMLRQICSKG